VSPTFERRLTRDWDDPSVIGIDGYRAKGGYEALRNALSMEATDIIEQVKASGLRGRGGAGFPTGVKWSFVPRDTGKPTYVVVNFDESEPGTCNNRQLVERDPHRLLEGAAIAALAIGCATVFVYVRGEYLWQSQVLETAIREAYEAGFFGKKIAGSDVDLDVVLHRGAGAYICGEETALLSSLEGFRGQPRLRPPFPAVEGLYASPTVINNVETLMSVPDIVLRGPEWFRELGTERSPGTKMFTISGKVERPGNYELPLGTPMRVLLEDVAGGVLGGRALKAWTPGGSSTPLLTAEHVDTPLDYESVQAAGSLLGRRDGPRRHRLRRGRRAADDPLLRARVVREVHAVPRGDVVGGARPGPDRAWLRP
jgi:NADH-quinone oxidoreductase subunit F